MAEPAQEVELEQGGIEVDIAQEGTTPAVEVVVAPELPARAAEQSAKPVPTVGVEALQSQIKALEGREQAALRERANQERIAREHATALAAAQEEIAQARGETVDARRATVDTSILAAQAESDNARREYQLALEAGDFGKASEANAKLIKAASQVTLLEDKKRTFADEAARPRPLEGAVRQPQRPTNEVDAYIETKSPRTQTWLRDHPECVTDPRMNNKTVGAHYEALAEGYSPDTEGYFLFIDRKLGFAGQPAEAADEQETHVEAAPVRRQKALVPAAPVSRDAPRGERSTSRMYLTRGEQEVAEALGITPSEYARRKQAMEKQGYYHT